MKLVADARHWWKWHSVHALVVIGIVAEAWLNSPQFQAMLPSYLVSILSPIVLGIVFVLRIRKQLIKTRTTQPPNAKPEV
ncbi:MAG TPA: hypothetical protein VFJ01_06140 [Oleiagrimonas sp.]|nr:hypothetical protein [Oleiagrimonas sp.]